MIAEIGLDNGRDEEAQGNLLLRRSLIVRKSGQTQAHFVAVIEPYAATAIVSDATIENEMLKIQLADRGGWDVDLAAIEGLEDRPNSLPFEVLRGPHEPPVASLAFFEKGVSSDTISWPVETMRCYQTVDDEWQYIEHEPVDIDGGRTYNIRGRYVHSYNYVLPPALKLYQYDADGALLDWSYLQPRLPRAREWTEIDISFTAVERATSAKPVTCTKGIGALWVTPLEIVAADG